MDINSEQIVKEKLRQLNESQLDKLICYLDHLIVKNQCN